MKRCEELKPLSREHHTALVMVKHALKAAAQDNETVNNAWMELKLKFESELNGHFKKEERLLLPLMKKAGLNELVDRTLNEHQLMRNLIVKQKVNGNLLKEFAELLKAHVRFEEGELFVAAEKSLSLDNLKEIQKDL
jgi:hemerythrin-like domain-containing protein